MNEDLYFDTPTHLNFEEHLKDLKDFQFPVEDFYNKAADAIVAQGLSWDIESTTKKYSEPTTCWYLWYTFLNLFMEGFKPYTAHLRFFEEIISIQNTKTGLQRVAIAIKLFAGVGLEEEEQAALLKLLRKAFMKKAMEVN